MGVEEFYRYKRSLEQTNLEVALMRGLPLTSLHVPTCICRSHGQQLQFNAIGSIHVEPSTKSEASRAHGMRPVVHAVQILRQLSRTVSSDSFQMIFH